MTRKRNKMKNITLILFSSLLFVACDSKPKSKLPIIGNFDLEYKKVNGKTTLTFAFNSPKLVFPIPLREIDANKNLVQNEGYQ